MTIRRGAEVFGWGLLFRVQEFALGYPAAPWTDLLRVDILNVIGVSMMLMGIACWFAKKRLTIGLLAGGTAAGIAMVTPLVWTTWQPRWMPWFVESYLNGCHNLGAPQPWLFPLFPWAGFAFAGLAAGSFLLSDRARRRPVETMLILGGAGAVCFGLGGWLDWVPVSLYPVYDFWHTSPNFFLMRAGVVMMIALSSYAWCRWGAGRWAFSPLIQLGQASLLVYWVHIEFVYGRFSILTKHGHSVRSASIGLLVIFVAMTLLAAARGHRKGSGIRILEKLRRKLLPVGEGQRAAGRS